MTPRGRGRILEVEQMTTMTPILSIPRVDPDIPCTEPGCPEPAAFLTAGGTNEDGIPSCWATAPYTCRGMRT